MDALARYQAARRASRWVGIRDATATTLGNAALRLASPEYRALVGEAIQGGLLGIVAARKGPERRRVA